MKKIITISVATFIIGFLISPVLGIAISSTRDLILSLASDEAILTLADEIDNNRMNIPSQEELINGQELKIGELECVIEKQKKELLQQREQLDKAQINTVQNINNASTRAESCSRVFYYENQYRAKDKNGKSFSYVKGESSVEKYYKIRGTIRDKYENDESYEKIINSIIKNIETDYQDYLRVKKICDN